MVSHFLKAADRRVLNPDLLQVIFALTDGVELEKELIVANVLGERCGGEVRVKKLLKGDYKPASIQPASEDSAPAVPDEAFAATNLEELARDQLAASIIRKFKGDKLEMLVEAILKAHSPSANLRWASKIAPQGCAVI